MSEINFLAGFLGSLSLTNLLYSLLGCLLGMLVGILPGLGPSAALSILLPIAIFMPPEASIIMMAGLYYGAMYGGSTTAILVNIPGEVSSLVTSVDGYAMTRAGRAGEALAIAAIGSYLAGVVGTIAIALVGPAIAKLALNFGPAEYSGLAAFSLATIVGFAGRSLLTGTSMMIFGIWLASIGSDPLAGTQRLTFGFTQLMTGIDIVPLTIGLFGIGEVLFNSHQKTTQVFTGVLPPWTQMLPRGAQLRRGLAASVRGTAVGGAMGLLPGMVPALSAFVAYDVDRKLSRHRAEFGSGAIEGVAAPEAANNANAMTSFIPLLSLGVPTSPALAIILGVLVINGIQPGPAMFTQHADLTYTVVGSMFVSNTMLLIMSLPLIGIWAKISKVPYHFLGPLILAVCVIGAFATRNSMFDIYIALLFGVLGYIMRRNDWPLPPLVLGFLMGPMLEQSVRQALGMTGGDPSIFFTRPIALTFFAATFIIIGISTYIKVRSEAVGKLLTEGSNDL